MCQPESRIRFTGLRLRLSGLTSSLGIPRWENSTPQGNRMLHSPPISSTQEDRIIPFRNYYLIVPLVRKILNLCLV